MKDSAILKVSMVTSLAGILALIVLTVSATPQEIPPDKITLNQTGELIKTSGRITEITDTPKAKILSIDRNLHAVIFTEDNLTLKKNQKITAIGTIQEYKNQPEMIVQKIETITNTP